MTARTEYPTMTELCAQIDEIGHKATTLIDHLQAERDALREALQRIAEHPRQPLGDGRRWAYELHGIACNALAALVRESHDETNAVMADAAHESGSSGDAGVAGNSRKTESAQSSAAEMFHKLDNARPAFFYEWRFAPSCVHLKAHQDSGRQRRKGNEEMTAIRTTIEFLSAALNASDMQGSRGRLDTFADRLVKAASEPTLSAAMEQLLRAVNASSDGIHPPLAARMLAIAGGPDGPRILRWWREQAKLVTLLAGTRDQELVEQTVATITLPAAEASGSAISRATYPITLRARCETPLSHGSDGKAGNATLFRRMQVLTQSGGVLSLPYYSGNALRGQMRDLLADHFVSSIGLPVSRNAPVVSLWFFYALYSGGALEENSDATKALKKQLGDHGAIRSLGIAEFRQMLPALSLLGCALGNRILSGHCQFADLRPVCHEWGTGERPVAELMSWEYLTRREDHEDHLVHHGMIANTEVLRAGAELEGGIDHDDAIPELELSALGRGVQLLIDRGMLGAENRRGLGRVVIATEGLPDPAPYDAFLAERKADILRYLESIGALADLAA